MNPWKEALAQSLNLPGRSISFKRALMEKVAVATQEITQENFAAIAREIIRQFDAGSSDFIVVIPYLGDLSKMRPKKEFGLGKVNILPSGKTTVGKRVSRTRHERLSHRQLRELSNVYKSIHGVRNCHVKVKAISSVDAFESATAQMQIYFGAVSFAELCGYRGRLISSTYAPISRFQIIGPSSVHTETGELATNTLWLQDMQRWLYGYFHAPWTDEIKEGLASNYQHLCRSISKQTASRREIVLRGLRQFYIAVSAEKEEERFLELWKLFEMLAITRNEPESKIPDRVSALWHEREQVRSVLRAMHSLRNSLIHRRHEGNSAFEESADTLLRFSLHFLRRVFFVERHIEEIEQLHRILDLERASMREIERMKQAHEIAFIRRKRILESSSDD